MTSKESVHVGTTGWQPDYVKEHLSHQVNYLESVASSNILQIAAANALTLLALSAGQSVLEVGCGSGVFLPALAERVGKTGRVTGIDHAPAIVSEARNKIAAASLDTTVSIDIGDALALPYPSATFDAAHCERVLMHLPDPSAALREMTRVVRPGGVVVAVEPDWLGIRFDHPDPEAFRLLYTRALPMLNKDMGLTLYRRFGELGLVKRQYLPATSVITDFSTFRMFGLQLEDAVRTLVAEGAMPLQRLEAVIQDLERASALGRFYSIATMHVVAGVVAK